MGKTTKNLLVSIFIGWLLVISSPIYSQTNANNYDAFWLWSGVKPQPVLNNAKIIYLLKGQIITSHNGEVHFVPQGGRIISDHNKQLWLVYRTHTLNWSENIFDLLTKQLKRWQNAGIKIEGIQIDFDVPTQQLKNYTIFLEKLRKWLPNDYKLSITGLLDWGNNAEPTALNKLHTIVDEVVLQTYQGRDTIPNYQQYLPKLNQLTVPFKIGLAQYGEWQEPSYLKENIHFKGYIIFLQNQK